MLRGTAVVCAVAFLVGVYSGLCRERQASNATVRNESPRRGAGRVPFVQVLGAAGVMPGVDRRLRHYEGRRNVA